MSVLLMLTVLLGANPDRPSHGICAWSQSKAAVIITDESVRSFRENVDDGDHDSGPDRLAAR